MVVGALSLVGCQPAKEPGDLDYLAELADDPLAGSGRPLSSREYKVLLDPELFVGLPHDMMAQLIADSLAEDGFGEGDAATLDKQRFVVFYDVPGGCSLRENGFVLRERGDIDAEDGGDSKVTLKVRSRDRFVAAAHDLGADDAKIKFEEDIVPPYESKYSLSAKLKLEDESISTVADARGLFAVLEDIEVEGEVALAVVGDVVVLEDVYDLGRVDLGELEAEVALTLWFQGDGPDPVIAEISFDYKRQDDDDPFPLQSVLRGIELFELLQELPRPANSTTKTAWVYGSDPSFCAP